jgi:predicted nucleotidyltransferase
VKIFAAAVQRLHKHFRPAMKDRDSSNQKDIASRRLSFFKIDMQNDEMKRDDIIHRLRACEAELRAQGVSHAALFGSVARGEQRQDSDIDIMIELDPAARVTMFDYVDIREYIGRSI